MPIAEPQRTEIFEDVLQAAEVGDAPQATAGRETELEVGERAAETEQLAAHAVQCPVATDLAPGEQRLGAGLGPGAIAGEGSTFSIPCGEDAIFEINPSLATVLDNKGWIRVGEGRPAERTGESLAERFVNADADLPSVAAFAYGNVEEEVRGVLADIKQIVLEGHSMDEIAVVVRDQDDMFRSLPL